MTMYDCVCTNEACDYADDECPIPVRQCPACRSATIVRRNGKVVENREGGEQ